jgi:hypothetical protein
MSPIAPTFKAVPYELFPRSSMAAEPPWTSTGGGMGRTLSGSWPNTVSERTNSPLVTAWFNWKVSL